MNGDGCTGDGNPVQAKKITLKQIKDQGIL